MLIGRIVDAVSPSMTAVAPHRLAACYLRISNSRSQMEALWDSVEGDRLHEESEREGKCCRGAGSPHFDWPPSSFTVALAAQLGRVCEACEACEGKDS